MVRYLSIILTIQFLIFSLSNSTGERIVRWIEKQRGKSNRKVILGSKKSKTSKINDFTTYCLSNVWGFKSLFTVI